MSALTDLLRERAARRGRTAHVSCGALGVLEVEALSPSDCAALAGRGNRAVLYAACRALQKSGEALRREGVLFQPDEIMQYVTDQEAEDAARAVLELSGVAPPERTADIPLSVDKEQTEPVQPAFNELEARWGDSPDLGEERENRLPFVQEPEKDFQEIRLDSVRTAEGKDTEPIAAALVDEPDFPKVRLEHVRKMPPENPVPCLLNAEKTEYKEEDGQASYEFPLQADQTAQLLPEEAETQNLPEELGKELQDVGWELAQRGSGPEFRGAAHEDKSESWGAAHEMESDLSEAPEKAVHEDKSESQDEAHETESDLSEVPERTVHEDKSESRDAVHETESELSEVPERTMHEDKSESRDAVHEMESDLSEVSERTMHEDKSESWDEMHETESDFEGMEDAIQSVDMAEFAERGGLPDGLDVERIAWALLEGLRLAAGAR